MKKINIISALHVFSLALAAQPTTGSNSGTTQPGGIVYVDYIEIWANGKTIYNHSKESISVGDNYIAYNIKVVNTNTGEMKGDTIWLNGLGNAGLKSKAMEYEDHGYRHPDISCDSLNKLCIKNRWGNEKTALNIFWGDVFSIFRGVSSETKAEASNTKSLKQKNTSVLMTRGWEYDCITGVFRLKVFFQYMQGGSGGETKVVYSKVLKEDFYCEKKRKPVR